MGRRKTSGSSTDRLIIRPVPGFPGYFAGTDGSMWSDKSGKRVRLNPTKSRNYLVCNLCRDGKCHVKSVHRWVLLAFRGELGPGQVSRHLDGDPTNNRLSNLRYGTHKANSMDTVRHGRCNLAELTEDKVMAIRQHYRETENATGTAEKFGISIQGVCRIVKGKSWRHLPVLLKPDPYGINTSHRRGGAPVECQCGHRFYTKAKKVHCGKCKQVEKVKAL